MMIIVGIDPGSVSGAFAGIDKDGGVVFSEPFTNWKDVKSLLTAHRSDIKLIGLEHVHGYPGMSVKAVSSFMSNFGGWIAALEILELSYELYPPPRWQKAILGSFPRGESKPRALEYARAKWPSLDLKKKDSGEVDALCIAEYARRVNFGS